jgi:hypothetical protein
MVSAGPANPLSGSASALGVITPSPRTTTQYATPAAVQGQVT